MLRVLLPPNLALTAPRDAIAVKIELDLTAAPPPAFVPALAALQRFGAAPAPVLFLQLSRAQLRELATALRPQPVFAFVNAPAKFLLWVGPILRGVSEHLDVPAPPLAGPPHADAAIRRPSVPSTSKLRTPPSDLPSSFTVDGSEHFLAVTLPPRESASYPTALAFVQDHGFRLEPSNRKWWLRDRHKVLNLLASHLTALRDEFHAEFTENFDRHTAHLIAAEITAEATAARDGFNLTLGFAAGTANAVTLQNATATGRAYLEDDQTIYLIDRAKLERLAAAQRRLAETSGTPGLTTRRTHRISPARVAEAQDILDELAPHFQPPAAWRERSAALRDLTTLPPAPLPAELNALLRPYQRLGVAWLWYLHHHDLGGILADEMGLGKTLQALALVAALQRREIPNPAVQILNQPHRRPAHPSSPNSPLPSSPSILVVCPASLVENWRREAARFTPQLRVAIHHRERRLADAAAFAAHDLVITSYATLARDEELFATVDFACVIADEAQHIKNRRSRNAQALRSLHATGRFLLTGTPLENSLDDLRSLFAFLMPGFLGAAPSGAKAEERAFHDERLRAQTARYILRRTKQAVAPELPAKIEQIVYCDLEPAQAALYRETQQSAERALLDLAATGATENALRFATLTQLLRLRQICCDPRLVTPAAPADHSAKLGAFRELLDEALDEGHRLLVFSQFTSLLALLRAELETSGIAYAYLDGAMTPRARQAEVDRFQNPAAEAPPVFLLSLKAGGTGLNLTAADTVVHFDPWWNPAVEAQATDRAHRIGQDRIVTSYKLICAGTVEEKVLALQASKRALLAEVFEASDAAAAQLDLADLRSLLA